MVHIKIPSDLNLKTLAAAGQWAHEIIDMAYKSGYSELGIQVDEPMNNSDIQKILDVIIINGFGRKIVENAKLILSNPENQDTDFRTICRLVGSSVGLDYYWVEKEVRFVRRMIFIHKLINTFKQDSKYCCISVSRNCCRTCRRLFLESNNDIPRVFLFSELPPQGNNESLFLDRWLPTIPPLHIGCECTISFPPFHNSVFPNYYDYKVTRLPSFTQEFEHLIPGSSKERSILQAKIDKLCESNPKLAAYFRTLEERVRKAIIIT